MHAVNDRSYVEFVIALVNALETANVPYAIAGSLAAMQYGEPRTTLDVDLTVHLAEATQIERLGAEFERANLRIDIVDLRERVAERSPAPANALDEMAIWKADLYLLQPEEYAQAAFSRRRQVAFEPHGQTITLYAPEDVILYKLMYHAMSPVVTKHLLDIAGMLVNLDARSEPLDTQYVSKWADQLGVREYWDLAWAEFQRR